MERRKRTAGKSSPIPGDYAKMVSEIFTSNFDDGLKKIAKLKRGSGRFEVHGAIFLDEVVLSVSLLVGKELAATTVYASMDYDPRASVPTIQDLLSACVDAIGGVFAPLLSEQTEGLIDQSLSALKKVPFHWTEATVERFKVQVKIDKSNPNLDRMADDWLDRNDPARKTERDEEHQETEKLFVTGREQKTKITKKPGGGSVH